MHIHETVDAHVKLFHSEHQNVHASKHYSAQQTNSVPCFLVDCRLWSHHFKPTIGRSSSSRYWYPFHTARWTSDRQHNCWFLSLGRSQFPWQTSLDGATAERYGRPAGSGNNMSSRQCDLGVGITSISAQRGWPRPRDFSSVPGAIGTEFATCARRNMSSARHYAIGHVPSLRSICTAADRGKLLPTITIFGDFGWVRWLWSL